MSWSLAEGICDTIKTYIEDNAATKLVAVQARYADGLTLQDFKAIVIRDPEAAGESSYPVLYIIPTDADLEVGPGGLRRGFLPTQQFEFAIIVEKRPEDGGTEDNLKRRAMRYLVALLEMLAESVTTTGVEWALGEQNPRLSYLPIYMVGERAFADVRLVISTIVREQSL